MCVQTDTLFDAADLVDSARHKLEDALELFGHAGVTVDEYRAMSAEWKQIDAMLAVFQGKLQDAKGPTA